MKKGTLFASVLSVATLALVFSIGYDFHFALNDSESPRAATDNNAEVNFNTTTIPSPQNKGVETGAQINLGGEATQQDLAIDLFEPLVPSPEEIAINQVALDYAEYINGLEIDPEKKSLVRETMVRVTTINEEIYAEYRRGTLSEDALNEERLSMANELSKLLNTEQVDRYVSYTQKLNLESKSRLADMQDYVQRKRLTRLSGLTPENQEIFIQSLIAEEVTSGNLSGNGDFTRLEFSIATMDKVREELKGKLEPEQLSVIDNYISDEQMVQNRAEILKEAMQR